MRALALLAALVADWLLRVLDLRDVDGEDAS